MMDNTTPAAQALTQQLNAGVSAQKQQAIDSMQAVVKAAPAATAPATPAPAPDEPASTLPSIDEIRARQEASEEKQAKKDSLDAIAYANALAEEAGDKQNEPTPKTMPTPATPTSASTSASTPDAGTMELTQKQADELSQQKDISVQTLAKEANRVAQQNKVLKNGDEVTISFH
jgi:hypothetical protein